MDEPVPCLSTADGPLVEYLIDPSAVTAHRSAAGGKRGEQNQAIGHSRGGRTTKIHALTEGLCRPVAFLLTGGLVADCKAGTELLDRLPECLRRIRSAVSATRWKFPSRVVQKRGALQPKPRN